MLGHRVALEMSLKQVDVDVFDPWVNPSEAQKEYAIKPVFEPEIGVYDAIVLAVAHKDFVDLGWKGVRRLGKKDHILYDLKSILGEAESDLRL